MGQVQHVQVAVVGLGALGSATAYHLSRRGVPVLGLEQFALGHVRGASHDTSRILRRSYHLPAYVRLAAAAYRDWAALEEAAQERLVTRTGGVTFCAPGEAVGVGDYAAALEACGVAYELLDGLGVRRRWPQFRVPERVAAVAQDDGSIVPAGRTVALLQAMSRASGAVLRAESPVQALEPQRDGVLVVMADEVVHADVVVVCADAWTNRLLAPLGATIPLVSTLEQVSYFQPEEPRAFAAETLPVWIWEDDPCYYGFPSYGESSIKAARDVSGIPVDLDDRSFEPVPQRLAELEAFLDALLPGKGRHLRTVTCQYTLTPDRDFVLGALPGHPSVLVALGAAHAYQFAPTIGRIMADLAVGREAGEDLSLFDPARASLSAASPVAAVRA